MSGEGREDRIFLSQKQSNEPTDALIDIGILKRHGMTWHWGIRPSLSPSLCQEGHRYQKQIRTRSQNKRRGRVGGGAPHLQTPRSRDGVWKGFRGFVASIARFQTN